RRIVGQRKSCLEAVVITINDQPFNKIKMKILITGNLGYIGPVLSKHLKNSNPQHYITGIDSGFFAHCLTGVSYPPEIYVDQQYYADVRNINEKMLEGYDAVVHL